MDIRRVLIIAAAFALALPLAALAQGSLEDLDEGAIRYISETRDLDGFGISRAETSTYSAFGFVPLNSDQTYYTFFDGYRYLSTGTAAGVGMDLPAGTDIPLGALVGSVCTYVVDSDSTAQIELELWQFEHPANTSGASHQKQLGSTVTSGVSWDDGYKMLCVVPLHRVTTFADINSDGKYGTISYAVRIDFTKSNVLTQHGAVSVLWQRQLSAAPASASFTDVPTGHWAFQHVEALKDSGITGGCGPTTFCPDSPVTRAQMAVFLAKALGLHFEN